MSVSTSLRALVVGAGVVVAAFNAGTAGAADFGSLDVDVEGGTHLFDSYEMYPGSSTESLVTLTNTGDGSAVVSMRVVDAVSDDNGCTPPESRVDTTCGDGEGELAADVVLTIEHDSDGAVPIVERAPLATLQEFVRVADLGASQTQRFRFTLELPASSGNETQSDSLVFSVAFVTEATQLAQSVVPPGPTGVTSVGARLSTGTLPQTGLTARPVLVLAAASVVVGLPLVRFARSRKAVTGAAGCGPRDTRGGVN